MRTIAVTRYVTPLREGGSLPAIVEADDDGLYVLKFRAAGHGVKALVAEVIAGEIGRALGLPVPELALATVDRDLARTEPDPEIHALIYDSAGLNAAMDYLPGAVNFDPVVHQVTDVFASKVVWFDAFVSNVDRTPRNTNMLMWHRAPWLIDHGSALYFHHAPGWVDDPARPGAVFPPIKDHVLLGAATELHAIDAEMAAALTPEVVDGVLAMVPGEWLEDTATGLSATDARGAYRRYLLARLAAPRGFVEEAARAR
ncbi:MAG: HipA family kinase [Vicinamibacterales bacterium]